MDQPGVVGTAARLPSNPGSQNEMPLSSACEVAGQSMSAAVGIAQPTRRAVAGMGITQTSTHYLQSGEAHRASRRVGQNSERFHRATSDSSHIAVPKSVTDR